MYQAEGFIFETEEEALQAKKEAEAIRRMKSQIHLEDTDMTLQIYNGLIDKHLFQTEVGLRYLFELQDYLYASPLVLDADIKPIPAHKAETVQNAEVEQKAKTAQKTQKEHTPVVKSYQKPFYITLFFTIVLAISVLGMFTITYLTGNSTNILNYENQIIDRYESWEQELLEKEAELNEREEALGGGLKEE